MIFWLDFHGLNITTHGTQDIETHLKQGCRVQKKAARKHNPEAITFSAKHVWQKHLVTDKSFGRQGLYCQIWDALSTRNHRSFHAQCEAAAGVTAPRTFLTTQCTVFGLSSIPLYLSLMSTSAGSALAHPQCHPSPPKTLENKQLIKLS